MSSAEQYKEIRKIDFANMDVSLTIIKSYKQGRETVYNPRYVGINERLAIRLRAIVQDQIKRVGNFEDYTLDCPEPEADQVRVIDSEETDFTKIKDKLDQLNPETDVIKNVNELGTAKAYLIILRNGDGIQAIGFKNLPENWKMRKQKRLIPLVFKGERFEDLEEENIFSISSSLDFLYYDKKLLIFSKKEFEKGLNFREGMLATAEELYKSATAENIFPDIEILKKRVGNNQRYLRKLATIKKLGYYQDKAYLKKLAEIFKKRNWGIEFKGGQIILTEENIDEVLILLQNKRLHSEITDEIFDVDSAKGYIEKKQPHLKNE